MWKRSDDESVVSVVAKTKRKRGKHLHYFAFDSEAEDPQDRSVNQKIEEGLSAKELAALHGYFSMKAKNPLQGKKRRKMAKYVRHQNLFYTSRCFMLYHFVQNILLWLLVIIFPAISVNGCVQGFAWMSHVAMGTFCVLCFIFDCVFAG